jgi:hypothetical protein
MLEYGTLGQLATEVGHNIQDGSAEMAVQVKESINNNYVTVARGHRWPGLLRISEERSSLTAGQKYLFLPKEVEQVYLIFPQNGMPPLQGRSLDQLIERYGELYAESGTAVDFAEAGEVGYCTEFYTTGETLTITHSGSGTVAGVVHGLTGGGEGETSGVEEREAISILQSTGVITTKTWKDLIAVSVAELAAGDVVTVTGTTSARIYAKIAAGERVAKYKRIRLMQPSGTADPYTLVWKKRVARLTDDNQAVEIPVGQILVNLVTATIRSSQREYTASQLHYGAAQQELAGLKTATEVDGTIMHQAIPGMNLRRGWRHGGGGQF